MVNLNRLSIAVMALVCVMVGGLTQATAAEGHDPGTVYVGNLIYAKTKTSKCFSNAFLSEVRKEAGISTEDTFLKVKLADEQALMQTPFCIMNGEGGFTLTAVERENLKAYLTNGGFLLASAGCSSSSWSSSMRKELTRIFGDDALHRVDTEHPLFHTLDDIQTVPLKSGGYADFEGVSIDGRLVCLFSKEGLNNTAKVKGCCCCGGNEVKIASRVVANALVYTLVE